MEDDGMSSGTVAGSFVGVVEVLNAGRTLSRVAKLFWSNWLCRCRRTVPKV